MKNLERLIEQVDGSMRIEGMPLTREDKERIRRCAGSAKHVEAEVQKLIQKHSAVLVDVGENRL